MFDVFYHGSKPNLFPHEQYAETEAHAKVKSRTKFFWFIDGKRDMQSFDFTWFPPLWEAHQTHVFVCHSQYGERFTIRFCPAANYELVEHYYDDQFIERTIEDRSNWTIPEEINAESIDFCWVPNSDDPPFIYHFGSEFQMSTGLIYSVPGATEIKFEPLPPVKGNSGMPVIQPVSMFFVDMNNKTANTRYAALVARYPKIQRIRFVNGWVETIKRCAARSESQKFWVVSSENVYDDFNFAWHAQPWQHFMTHVFASQWQKWSDTFLINKLEFSRHTKWAKTIEEFPNLNFVSDQPVYRPDDIYDIYYIDHFNTGSQTNLERIKRRYPAIKSARYVDNYLDTLKRIVTTTETEYVWIINSICDYSKFDFTWQPEPWQAKMLHVFPSDDQKFGDTFYMHVPTFKEQMDKIDLLDWFDTVNYCTDQTAPRLPIDEIEYDCDSAADAIKQHDFTGPFAIFKHTSTMGNIPKFSPSIWRKKDRVVHVFAKNGAVIYAPRECKPVLDTQVYDFPYIMTHRDQFVTCKNLDIVYISNGEPDEQRWYDHLVKVASGQQIHWVRNVKGRSNAYKEAARLSTTPWFFATFAKLEVLPEFDWSWQPDLLQQPKHYMFDAINPVNGLRYGHMGIIAYHKALTLKTDEYGLDFTLSAKHESTELLSGIAHYNVNPIVTWRTAFRECIKLHNANDRASYDRLQTWLTVANGNNAEWSIKGAKDAVEYYESVNGNIEKLMLSKEWDWLNTYYAKKYQS